MEPLEYFYPGLNFERLATDDQALQGFQSLLKAFKEGEWDVTQAVEATDENGIKGLKVIVMESSE